MKDAKDVIPWKVTDISIRPYEGFWSFNPSVHFDGETWRCVLRCCDYAMPDGVTIRSSRARLAGQLTKNAMVILDPTTWKPIKIYKMQEKDDYPRVACPHYGYEDMRLFKTDKGGLQGIAASLHLRREGRVLDIGPQVTPGHQPPEQVLLSFDDEYHIVGAQPIRGDGWSGTPQKNWVPFDHTVEPRFIYSIDKGTLFDHRGSVHGEDAIVRPSALSPSTLPSYIPAELPLAEFPLEPLAEESAKKLSKPSQNSESRKKEDRRAQRQQLIRGGDVKIVRGGRLKVDAHSSRPTARSKPSSKRTPARLGDESLRLLGAGHGMPKYNGLRGGTQLVRVADDAWLGIGHEMKFVGGKKLYWHTWYVVNSRGKMTAASMPCKLAPEGIEFAAGMAIDGDRVVVSFGVDDMECKIGETSLSAVMEMFRPIGQ